MLFMPNYIETPAYHGIYFWITNGAKMYNMFESEEKQKHVSRKKMTSKWTMLFKI